MSGGQNPPEEQTLDEVARNPDGTYNGYKMLAWLSNVLHPGVELSPEDVQKMAEEIRMERNKNGTSL